MADDGSGIVLVLIQKFLGAGEGNLVDVFIDVLGGHSYAMIGNSESAFFLINSDTDIELPQLSLKFSEGRESAYLLSGINSIADKLTQEDLMIAIEKFFDYGENILGRNPDFTCLHDIYLY